MMYLSDEVLPGPTEFNDVTMVNMDHIPWG
jgi:hypothetical protein